MAYGITCPIKMAGFMVVVARAGSVYPANEKDFFDPATGRFDAEGFNRVKHGYPPKGEEGYTHSGAYSEAVGCNGTVCGMWDKHRGCCGLIQVVE